MAHGGHRAALAQLAGVPLAGLTDASANLNPLGFPPWLRQELSAAVTDLAHYPDPDCQALTAAASLRFAVAAEEIVCGNGASELIQSLPVVLGSRRVLVVEPGYVDYRRAARLAGVELALLTLSAAEGFRLDAAALSEAIRAHRADLVFVGSPNNPSGTVVAAETLRRICRAHPGVTVAVDEAFADFVTDFDSLVHHRPANAVVLRSLTKIYAIPGLRLGIALAHPSIVSRWRDQLPPWTVNHLAQTVGARALADCDFARETATTVRGWREDLMRALSALPGVRVIPGAANFLLCCHAEADLSDRLLRRHAVAVRRCDDYPGLDACWFRVAVRPPDENARLLAALGAELTPAAPAIIRPHRARALMVQGTSSGAGKSVLVAALCRILLQDGVRVCPFKAQNMSLNSGVTRDGRELGRAQVVQAMAARLEPDVRMNPVLLKPQSDTGSQVIVLGKPIGNAAARPYMREVRQTLRDTVHRAYDELASEHDLMVLEGAGSPGEVNLKHGDLVNMHMARHAEAPVLLVGDIDRGGLYASFVGHLEVMEEWERRLVAGYVVNRFRGDAALLADAHDYVQRHTGVPVLGVIPFRRDLGLPEEDGVVLEEWRCERPGAALDVAVIELRHASNFTDLDALRIEPDVQVRLVSHVEALGRPDAVIIPGSKNTLADLAGLEERGFAKAIIALTADPRCEVVGICGGLQMLGRQVSDPHAIESGRGSAAGLGFIPVDTVLDADKTLLRGSATHLPSGLTVRGYEIHHGLTAIPAALALFRRADGAVVGAQAPQGRCWGTYLHGVFDDDRFRRYWLDGLRQAKGLHPLGAIQATYDVDAAIDRFADLVRESVDMGAIRRLVGLA
jgi:cobyric acid synthase CobQ/L-threonine-O-3-phosphate decarboxylase